MKCRAVIAAIVLPVLIHDYLIMIPMIMMKNASARNVKVPPPSKALLATIPTTKGNLLGYTGSVNNCKTYFSLIRTGSVQSLP